MPSITASIFESLRPVVGRSCYRITALIDVDRGNIAAGEYIADAIRLAGSDCFYGIAAAAPALWVIIRSVDRRVIDAEWRLRPSVVFTVMLPAPTDPIGL